LEVAEERRNRSFLSGWWSGCFGSAIADAGDDGFDGHGRAFLHQNFAQDTSSGGRNFSVHLVGRYFK
jgi:hypothetical protein